MKNYIIKKYLNNDFYFFFCFAVGVAFFVSVVLISFTMATAFSSDIEKYKKDFKSYEITLNSGRYLNDLREKDVFLYAKNQAGLTYGVSLSKGDDSVALNSYEGGLAILYMGRNSFLPIEISPGDLWTSEWIATQLNCHIGDAVQIAGKEYRFVGSYDNGLFDDVIIEHTPSFLIYCEDVEVVSFNAVFFDLDQGIEFVRKVKSTADYEDENGVLDYYKGMKLLGGAFFALAGFAILLYVLYYIVTISIYLMRKKVSMDIFRIFGAKKSGYAFSVSACFAIVSLIGSAVGLLMSLGLKRIINFWASDILGVILDFNSLFVIFGCVTVASFAMIWVVVYLLSWRLSRDSALFC